MLTVADIAQTEALRLTLRGGLGGSDRPVRWVHISELPDPTPWLRGGELLLTTGPPLDSGPAAYVERLAAADRLGFPLFTIPWPKPMPGPRPQPPSSCARPAPAPPGWAACAPSRPSLPAVSTRASTRWRHGR